MGTIGQQTAHQFFVTSALHMDEHKLTGRIDSLGFPGWRTFVTGIAMPFVCGQGVHLDFVHLFIVKGFTMLAQSLVQPPHRARVHLHQPGRAFQGAAFG
jgi:hypothetical protein